MGGRKPAMGGRKPAMGAPKPAMEYSFLKYDPAMMSTHSMPCTGDDCLGYSMDYSMPCTGGDCMGYSMDMHYDWSEPEYSMDMHYDWSEPEMPMYSFLKYDPAMMSTHSMPCTGGDCMGYSMDYSMPCTGGYCMGYSMDYSMPCTGGDCMGSMDMHYDWYTPDYAWSEPEMPMYSTSFLKYHHALDAMWSDAYTGHNALYDDMSSPCQGSACHGMWSF